MDRRSPPVRELSLQTIENMRRARASNRILMVVPRLLTVVLCLSSLAGCGYMVGNLYKAEVRTVEVPIFQNDTFRRGIEYQLTEAVQKEIQTRTSYRLAKGPGADTRLTGRIVGIRKNVLGETQFDDPRELQLSLFVVVTWEDLRTGQLLASEEVPLQPQAIPITGQVNREQRV